MPRSRYSSRYSSRSRKQTKHKTHQTGGRVVLPSEYFGKDSGMYGDFCGAPPFQTAYGMTSPSNKFAHMDAHGRIVGKPHQTYLAAGGVPPGTHATHLQTGGGHRARRRQQKKKLRK